MSQQGLPPGSGQGVDKYDGFFRPNPHDLKDEDLLDWHTVNYCIERLKNAGDKPFFLACGLFKPHLAFAVPQKYHRRFPLDEIELPPFKEEDLDDIPPAGVRMAKPNGDHARHVKGNTWKLAIQSYLAACAYTDMNVGRLLDALEKSPHRDNTIIVLWGDHGWSFGEKHHWRKFALWEEPTRVPLIWVVPGLTAADSTCARTVDLTSIYPTLCELAGLPIPAHVEGKSVVPLLRNPQTTWSLPAITTYGRGNHTVRTETFRYIRYADGSEELYQSEEDPYEWTNLAGDSSRSEIKRDLARWLPKTEAPSKPKAASGQAGKKKRRN